VSLAILDNSVIRALYHLSLFEKLNLLYQRVLIPESVQREFLAVSDPFEQTRRFRFLTYALDEHRRWFQVCREHDTSLMKILMAARAAGGHQLDEGEAEALSQNSVLGNIADVLLDERRGRKYASTANIPHHGVLHILAVLDVRLRACDYFQVVDALVNTHGVFFSSNVIEYVHAKVKKDWA